VADQKVGIRQRWAKARPTKAVAFWSSVVAVALTMIIGFSLGGWVTGGTAQGMAETASQQAVVNRLAPICVTQFNLDPDREQKLLELQETRSFQRPAYVSGQGWATMPGEAESSNLVARECSRLLLLPQ
jgi:alpha/beta superfamily hydrolase